MSTTLKDLNKNPDNPRSLGKLERENLIKSLAEFGDLSGIIFNRTSGHLVGGNQRTAKFKSLKSEIEITESLEKPDAYGTVARGFINVYGTQFSYREVEWDHDKETRANIAANKHKGEFVWPKVAEIIAKLPTEFDRSLLGFDERTLQNLLMGERANKRPPAAKETLVGLNLRSITFTAEQWAIIQPACEIVRSEYSEMNPTTGRCLELICADFSS